MGIGTDAYIAHDEKRRHTEVAQRVKEVADVADVAVAAVVDV